MQGTSARAVPLLLRPQTLPAQSRGSRGVTPAAAQNTATLWRSPSPPAAPPAASILPTKPGMAVTPHGGTPPPSAVGTPDPELDPRDGKGGASQPSGGPGPQTAATPRGSFPTATAGTRNRPRGHGEGGQRAHRPSSPRVPELHPHGDR